jgi:hypothetical protein
MCQGAKNDAMLEGSAENEATGAQGEVTEKKAEKKVKNCLIRLQEPAYNLRLCSKRSDQPQG